MNNLKTKIMAFLSQSSNQKKIIPLIVILIVLEIGVLFFLKKDNFLSPQNPQSAQISQTSLEDDEEDIDDDDVVDVEDLAEID